MWTTFIQLSELLSTSKLINDDVRETKTFFLTTTCSSKQPLVSKIASYLNADYIVSDDVNARHCSIVRDSHWLDKTTWTIKYNLIQKKLVYYFAVLHQNLMKCEKHEIALFNLSQNFVNRKFLFESTEKQTSIILPGVTNGYALITVDHLHHFNLQMGSGNMNFKEKEEYPQQQS